MRIAWRFCEASKIHRSSANRAADALRGAFLRQRAGQQLFFGFGNVTRASERWQRLSRRKLAELEGLMDGIKTMRRLLKR